MTSAADRIDDGGHRATLTRELRRLMQDAGLNARSLSLRAGLNATCVRDLLEGRSRSPETTKLARIEDALGVARGSLTLAATLAEPAMVVGAPEDLRLLGIWRALGEDQRASAMDYLAFLKARGAGATPESGPPESN